MKATSFFLGKFFKFWDLLIKMRLKNNFLPYYPKPMKITIRNKEKGNGNNTGRTIKRLR